ncbi:placenta-specific gene 8 protein-like [Microcebus murinus]|uniref:placenta-specific gene 8 protein-like n=1 Tax=Microcebus murinus TaxID=30608 RepID=UPI003F6C0E29
MSAVYCQPGYVSRSVALSDWQSAPWDCCDDMKTCLCGTFCPCVLAAMVAEDLDEFCLCGGNLAIRTLYRTRYGIPGSLCGDWLWWTFCCPCTLCQLKRDVEMRKELCAL